MSAVTKIRGDRNVLGVVTSQRNNQNMLVKTLSALESLTVRSAAFQKFSASSQQDVVLPDATTLPLGWEVTVLNVGTATLKMKTSAPVTPLLLQDVLAQDTYRFVCVDNATQAGVWKLAKFNGDVSATPRVIQTVNADTDWGSASGGVYSIVITGATHGLGTAPQIRLEEIEGNSCTAYRAKEVVDSTTGDITISVNETPDARCASRVVLS